MRCPFPGLILAFTLSGPAVAQDWPQWRGPERTGAVTGGVRLLKAMPEAGLPVLWTSEPIPDTESVSGDGSNVGYSTPVAAGGRVYLYLNQKVRDESPLQLPWGILNRLGCFDNPLPVELARKVEAARNSPQRAALKSDEATAWAGDWVARNLSHAQHVALAAAIEDRLIRGAAALDLETLEKLAALRSKPHADEEALEMALGEAGLERKRVRSIVEELTAQGAPGIQGHPCLARDLAEGRQDLRRAELRAGGSAIRRPPLVHRQRPGCFAGCRGRLSRDR